MKDNKVNLHLKLIGVFSEILLLLYFMFWAILNSNLIFSLIFHKIIFFPENPSESKGGSTVRSESTLPGLIHLNILIFTIFPFYHTTHTTHKN